MVGNRGKPARFMGGSWLPRPLRFPAVSSFCQFSPFPFGALSPFLRMLAWLEEERGFRVQAPPSRHVVHGPFGVPGERTDPRRLGGACAGPGLKSRDSGTLSAVQDLWPSCPSRPVLSWSAPPAPQLPPLLAQLWTWVRAGKESPALARYDRGTNTFSPEGRLFQIESRLPPGLAASPSRGASSLRRRVRREARCFSVCDRGDQARFHGCRGGRG
jgi:20S proteasome, alpha and beta subunits